MELDSFKSHGKCFGAQKSNLEKHFEDHDQFVAYKSVKESKNPGFPQDPKPPSPDLRKQPLTSPADIQNMLRSLVPAKHLEKEKG